MYRRTKTKESAHLTKNPKSDMTLSIMCIIEIFFSDSLEWVDRYIAGKFQDSRRFLYIEVILSMVEYFYQGI